MYFGGFPRGQYFVEERVLSLIGDASVKVESVEGFNAAALAFAAATAGVATAEVVGALFA